MYCRISSNIELLALYVQINDMILDNYNDQQRQNQQPSRLFRSVTNTLREIKQAMERIEVKLSF